MFVCMTASYSLVLLGMDTDETTMKTYAR